MSVGAVKFIKNFLSFHPRSFYDLVQNQFQHVKIDQNSHRKIIHDHKHGDMVRFYFDEPFFAFPSFEFFDLARFRSTFIISIFFHNLGGDRFFSTNQIRALHKVSQSVAL